MSSQKQIFSEISFTRHTTALSSPFHNFRSAFVVSVPQKCSRSVLLIGNFIPRAAPEPCVLFYLVFHTLFVDIIHLRITHPSILCHIIFRLKSMLSASWVDIRAPSGEHNATPGSALVWRKFLACHGDVMDLTKGNIRQVRHASRGVTYWTKWYSNWLQSNCEIRGISEVVVTL